MVQKKTKSGSKSKSTPSKVSVSPKIEVVKPQVNVENNVVKPQPVVAKSSIFARIKKFPSTIFPNEVVRDQVLAVIAGLVVVGLFIFTITASISWVNYNNDNVKTARETQEAAKQSDAETGAIGSFENRSVKFATNYGNITINLAYNAAPKTVESFLRLTYRGKYNSTIFHRYINEDSATNPFHILQGGDYEKGDGTGGKSAFGDPLPDEIWKTAPVLDANGNVTNTPEFTDPSLYPNYDRSTNKFTLPKGFIAMANSGANTGGSQFFITTGDTILGTDYTVFGRITDTESLATLDNIVSNVKTVANPNADPSQEPPSVPDKKIELQTAQIL